MKLEFHHIGLATQNISATIETMSNIGKCEILPEPVTDPLQNAVMQMVKWNGIIIEIIAGKGEKNL